MSLKKTNTGLPKFPERMLISNKGNYGVVLGVGGSRGMAGAVALAGRAGLLVGAGLSRLAVPSPVLETVAGFYPESTTIPLPADRNGKISLNAFDKLISNTARATSLFIGTGLGRSAGLDRLVPKILCYAEAVLKSEKLNTQAQQRGAIVQGRSLPPIPAPVYADEFGELAGVVVDADAINALSGQIPIFKRQKFIFTPHSAEFKRLLQNTDLGDVPDENDQVNRMNVTKIFAQRYNVIVVLKGHETIVTDGGEVFINNKSGNPGMATGGSGDVLTGILAGLIARGFGVFDAAKLGVYLHGVAGDIAAKKYGIESVIATHILESIPHAILRETV